MFKYKLLTCISFLFFSNIVCAADLKWEKITLEDGLSKVDAVRILSPSGEEKLSIFRKDPKRPSQYPPKMVFLKFEVNGMDQIQSTGNVIYKASKGKAFPLGTTSLRGRLTGNIESTAFHGQSDTSCGIVGNIIHSDELTVRYQTTDNQTRDIKFILPKDSSPIYDLLGFDKVKDCIEVN